MQAQASSRLFNEWDSGRQGTDCSQGHRPLNRPLKPHCTTIAGQSKLLAHELVQGTLVRFSVGMQVRYKLCSNVLCSYASPNTDSYGQVKWSTRGSISRPPPTCVLVHGIMGCRRNMFNFASRLTRVCHPLCLSLIVPRLYSLVR